jgi:hypothetical protein
VRIWVRSLVPAASNLGLETLPWLRLNIPPIVFECQLVHLHPAGQAGAAIVRGLRALAECAARRRRSSVEKRFRYNPILLRSRQYKL